MTASFSTYIVTWITLVVLAAVSIIVSAMETGIPGTVLVLAIATAKAALILSFFMHLGYEGRFFKLAFLLPFIVFAFSIAFILLDVVYR